MNIRNDKTFRCTNCGKVTYPKRAVCLKCGHRKFEVIAQTDNCRLLTFSQIFQLPWGMNDLYATIGICEFENGAKAMGKLTTPDVKAGDSMKARWSFIRQIKGDDIYGWIFEPA